MKRIKSSSVPGSTGDMQGGNAREMNPSAIRETNPLKIDLVLETLFSLCSVRTLKNCRLVCKQWKDVSLKAWRNKAILCPGQYTKGLPNLQQYIKLLQSKTRNAEELQLQKYPFKNFRLLSNLTHYSRETSKPVSDIARRIILQRTYYASPLAKLMELLEKSPSLQVLEMENCDWKTTGSEEPQSVEKLKSLRISRNSENLPFQFEDWEFIFKCFKRLETLSIGYRYQTHLSFGIKKILTCLKNVKTAAEERGETVMAHLKELTIVHIFEEMFWTFRERWKNADMHIISPILECHFTLESLTIHVVWDKDALEADVHPLYKLLDSCRDTLQHLNVSFNSEVSDGNLRLYLQKKKLDRYEYELRMEVLKEVHLCNGLWGLIILAGLDLPNLEKLVIDNTESTKKMKGRRSFVLPFPETRLYGNLKTFEFLDNRKILGISTIKAFAKIMPKLVNLTMPLDKFTFAIVCESFKELKTLNALPPSCRYEPVVDLSFTGISNGATAVDEESRKSDFIFLTDLNTACETQLQGNVVKIDHAVIYAFSQLPLLRHLTIDFKEVQISEEDKGNSLAMSRKAM